MSWFARAIVVHLFLEYRKSRDGKSRNTYSCVCSPTSVKKILSTCAQHMNEMRSTNTLVKDIKMCCIHHINNFLMTSVLYRVFQLFFWAEYTYDWGRLGVN